MHRAGWVALGAAILAFGGAAGCGDDAGGTAGGGAGATSGTASGGGTVPGCGTVTDIDGNEYETVVVGEQCWMRSNLRVASYNDGTPIPEEQDAGVWSDLVNEEPAWCNYNNDPANDPEYGKLYNGFAVLTDRLCPAGWRAPTNDEWGTLLATVGNSGDALRAKVSWGLKEDEPTNESGFTALPGGHRDQFGEFANFATDTFPKAHFWSSTTETALQLWTVQLEPLAGVIRGTQRANAGLSLRCIQSDSGGGGGAPTLEPGVYDGSIQNVDADACPNFSNIPPRQWELSYPSESMMTLTTPLLSGGTLSISCSLHMAGATCESFSLSAEAGPNSTYTGVFEPSEIAPQSPTTFVQTQPITFTCEGPECSNPPFDELPCVPLYEIAYAKQP